MGRTPRFLEVTFDAPHAGGFTMRIATAEAEFTENFSHIYPTLRDLCAGLWEAGKRIPARAVAFLLGPAELELRIEPVQGDRSELTLHLYPDHVRGARSRWMFGCVMPTPALVLAFWRALRRLQTCLPPERFRAEWREPFPDLEMAALTTLVESWKAER